MSDDGLVRALSAYGDFGEEELWDRFKNNFVTRPPEFRIESLKIADQWLKGHQQEDAHPTKELASLLTRKRELRDLHFALRKAGR